MGSHRTPSPPTATQQQRVGSVVRGKYRVDAFIATGTMANVYAATHRNGARVALKILHPQLARDPSLCERFKREGYFANSIGHPGVVRAIDDDVTEDGCAFLVMELLEGETLEERRVRKGGKLPAAWVLPVADALLDILGAAHSREVVHRDLKPDNVFLTKDGDVKVLDFGVARWNDGKSSSDMTGVGMVLGTPAFMPPEQALGKREEVDARSDIWAVGATLFVVLSGEPVHGGGDAKQKLIATARNPARPLRDAAPQVPRAVAAVVDRALAFDKRGRWPDTEAMREAIRWARMSLEGDSEDLSSTGSMPVLEAIPPPVPTRRGLDDEEPTVARNLAPSDAHERPTREPDPPQSRDFLTSAPPITLRDLPRSAAASAAEPSSMGPVFSLANDPVFSLRQGKDPDGSPSTERIPTQDRVTDPALAVTSAPLGIAMPTPQDMASYDPSAATEMGTDAPPSSDQVFGARSVEVNMSFTRPMAVLHTGFPAPRPAAGEPAPTVHAEPPPAPLTATLPHGTSSPPAAHPSAPPVQNDQMAYAGASRSLPTSPSMPVTSLASVAARHSLPPETPGPLLGQIVKPRRFMRVVVPVVLLIGALAAIFVVLRTRAANARAVATKGLVVPSSAPAISPGTTASTTPTTAAPPSVESPPPPRSSASVASAAASPAASVEAKRPKPKKPRPKPAAVAPVKSADETPSPPPPSDPPTPIEPAPKDSLPQKEPEGPATRE